MIFFTNAKQEGLCVKVVKELNEISFEHFLFAVYPIIREYDKPVLFNKAGAVSQAEALSLTAYSDHPSKIQRRPSIPPVAAPSHPKVRKDFPETWLWHTIILDE